MSSRVIVNSIRHTGASVDGITLDSSGNFSTNGSITATGTITDSKGNIRKIIISSKSSAYTLVAADAGKAIYISTGGVTVPNAVFSAGDAITIINNSGSSQTITQGTNVTMYNTADAATGNLSLIHI